MPLYKRSDSSLWQIKIEIGGRIVRRSSGTDDRKAAQELEQQIREELWREIKLGETRYCWRDALEKCRLEDSGQRSFERTERALKIISEYIPEHTLLEEITYDALLQIRELLLKRPATGNGWKTTRERKPSTVNRELAVIGSILQRCAGEDWGRMIANAPNIPLYEIEKKEPRWITREQAHALIESFPPHTRDMMILALATGLRRSNVTGLQWERIDLERRSCYVPAEESKTKRPIPVELNEDAIVVLKRWQEIHKSELGQRWSQEAHKYVFVYRSRAPIKQVTTRMWREHCKAVGLEGVVFHTLRHTWASWQVQSGTPLRVLQDLGGWASLQMPSHYAHLAVGHLSGYSDRVLLGESPGTNSCTVENGTPKP